MKNSKVFHVILLVSIVCCFAGCSMGSDKTTLKGGYKDDFLVGGALNRNLVMGQDPNAAAIASAQFNTATP